MFEFWWAYLLLGAVVGFIAGMLGAGGGLMMVPLLALIFEARGFPPQQLMHLAIATCMASVLFTSLASGWSHHREGAVRWDIVRALLPGIVTGALAASALAGGIDVKLLTLLFIAFVYYASARMLLGVKPKPSQDLPGTAGMLAMGVLIGAISSLAAIAGAALSVPFMVKCNVRVHEAIGTSAAIGLPIAAAATLGYIWSGAGVPLPAHSIGYIYLPALFLIAIATTISAPLGAKIAHRTPADRLRRIFALILLALATRMLWKYY
jgi:uncharacterized protein